ncbi:MAG: outer membrane protein assembly factor BamD [Gammaproteobacteria bacterium]|nr:MAG: outer membrane protein assembly factor BamD [Gammaproteobacteria bacterium]
MRFPTLVLTCATLVLCSCAWLGEGKKEEADKSLTAGYSEKDFYDVIQKDLGFGSWERAITNLEALEAQYPFGEYAEQAQLELIYAYYKMADYEAAIAAADRFIRLHPQHPNVDYAFYLKGLSSFVQSKGFFEQFVPTDETKRDPGTARNSFATFNELLSRYPESPYASDARKRMVYLRNILARHEIHVANYYFLRGAYLAAANRGRYVVENFQMTPAVPDGLAVMAEAYYLMQMYDLADDAASLLAANYPNHPSLDAEGNYQYQDDPHFMEPTWLNKMTLGLYDRPEPPRFDTRHIYNERYRELGEEGVKRKNKWMSWLTLGILD